MLYYDRIDAYERINVNKKSESKKFHISLYWYFLDKGFKSQPYCLQWVP